MGTETERCTIGVLCVTHQGCVWKEQCSAVIKIEICGISENRLSCHRCTAGMTSPLCYQPSPQSPLLYQGNKGKQSVREEKRETGVGVLGWTEWAEEKEREREMECLKQKSEGGGGGGCWCPVYGCHFIFLCSSIALFSSPHSISQTLYVWRPASILCVAFSFC